MNTPLDDQWRAELPDGTTVPLTVEIDRHVGISPRIVGTISLPLVGGTWKETITLNTSEPMLIFTAFARALKGKAILLAPGMESRSEFERRTRWAAFTVAALSCDLVANTHMHHGTEPAPGEEAKSCAEAIRELRDGVVIQKVQSLLTNAKIAATVGIGGDRLHAYIMRRDDVSAAKKLLGDKVDGMPVSIDYARPSVTGGS